MIGRVLSLSLVTRDLHDHPKYLRDCSPTVEKPCLLETVTFNGQKEGNGSASKSGYTPIPL